MFTAHDRLALRISGKKISERLISVLFDLGRRLDAALDNRSLHRYSLLLIVSALAAGGIGLWGQPLTGSADTTPALAGTLAGHGTAAP